MKCAGLPNEDSPYKACGKDVSFCYTDLHLSEFCERVRRSLTVCYPLLIYPNPTEITVMAHQLRVQVLVNRVCYHLCLLKCGRCSKTKASNSITSSASVPSDKVLIQPLTSYIVFSMQSGSVGNMKNATVGFFSD